MPYDPCVVSIKLGHVSIRGDGQRGAAQGKTINWRNISLTLIDPARALEGIAIAEFAARH